MRGEGTGSGSSLLQPVSTFNYALITARQTLPTLRQPLHRPANAAPPSLDEASLGSAHTHARTRAHARTHTRETGGGERKGKPRSVQILSLVRNMEPEAFPSVIAQRFPYSSAV